MTEILLKDDLEQWKRQSGEGLNRKSSNVLVDVGGPFGRSFVESWKIFVEQ